MPGLVVLFVCFFVSGAVGLVYEVVWLRMLGLVFGHTVYAITTMLAACNLRTSSSGGRWRTLPRVQHRRLTNQYG